MQTRKDDGVFPLVNTEGDFLNTEFGLTKREFFAAAALQGILANPDYMHSIAASEAVRFADKLIFELNQTASNEKPNSEKQPTQETGTET